MNRPDQPSVMTGGGVHAAGHWTDRAACKGDPLGWYFPDTPTNTGRRNPRPDPRALAACRACPVAAECLNYALDVGDHHAILGGTTPAQRRRWRTRRTRRPSRLT